MRSSKPLALRFAALALTSWMAAIDAASAEDGTRTYQIAEQSLGQALREFALASNLDLLFSPDLVAGKKSPSLDGKFTVDEGMRVLLQGSGLEFSVSGSRVVISDSKLAPSRQTTPSTSTLQGTNGYTRLVQADTAYPSQGEGGRTDLNSASASRQVAGPAETQERFELEEIVVTGTHIKGAGPIGSGLIVIGREEIAESGRGRVQDYMETLSQNFSGSASDDSNADSRASNLARGQAIDLRGLGANSTLVLVNGRRRPTGGLQGAFVDISSIPSSAIERIEILTDGASAIYGADAIGGVVNFILRKDYEGVESSARFASIGGHADDLQGSLIGGHSWNSGNFIAGYQYSTRDALMLSDTYYGPFNRDYRAIGGHDTREAGGNPGTITRTGRPSYAIPTGQDGTGLTVSGLSIGSNYQDYVTDLAALPKQRQNTAFFALNQSLTRALDVFVEGNFSDRDVQAFTSHLNVALNVPRTNPFYVNPYGDTNPVTVVYDFSEDLGGPLTQVSETRTHSVTAGVTVDLPSQWNLNVAATYGQERNEWETFNQTNADRRNRCLSGLSTSGCPGAPINPFGDGTHTDPATIAFVREVRQGEGVSSVDSVTAIAGGPVLSLPAGALKLAIGTDYREERLRADIGSLAPLTGVFTSDNLVVGNLERDVKAVFGELVLPVLGDTHRIPGARNLMISVAGRYEEYSDFGSSSNPKVGVSFSPFEDLRLRGSWGKSFRAPRFNELSPTNQLQRVTGASLQDPASSTGRSDVLLVQGSDPDLQPETAEMWTAGVDFTPNWASGFRASATYFHIDYTDKIAVGSAGALTLLDAERWAPVIQRNPSAADVAALCSRSDFRGVCPANPQTAVIINSQLTNLGGVRVRGVDFDLKYRAPLGRGTLGASLAGTRTFTYEQALTFTSPFVSVLDSVGFPLGLKARATLGWSIGRWSMNVAANYLDDYRNPVGTPDTIESWTTMDCGLTYGFDAGWLGGTDLRLSAINVLDKEPPFADQTFTGFDGANASQEGRSIALAVTKRW